MDTTYTTQLLLTALFFAPGVILFAGLAFVGLLMGLEKLFGQRADGLQPLTTAAVEFAATGNPAPGRIVQALKTAMAQDTAQPQRNARK